MSYTPGIPATRVVRFGVFELDPHSGELRKDGREVRLVGQPMQILRLLVERRGEIVTRDELRRVLWAADTFVDFDVSLSSAVKKLRDALGDSAENPRFIQTLPRRGYRFITPVEEATNGIEKAPLPVEYPRRRALVATLIVVVPASLLALWWRVASRDANGAVQPAPIRSIAVLPFHNLTGDPSQEYLVDGITDGLTTELAEVPGLRVISRTSVMRFRKSTKPLPDIARELKVDAIVEGSVMRTGEQLQMSVQLIDAATDRHLWAHKCSGELRDAMALESTIAQSIASAVGLPSGAPRRPASAMNPQAFDAYLKGVFAAGGQNADGFRNAIRYFEDAIAKEPDCAICYAWLAQTRLQLVYGGQPPTEVVPKAEDAARKALQIDPDLALAHRALGVILHVFYWRWEDGDRELQRARDLGPNSPDAHRAIATSLLHAGRYREAIAELDRVRSTDPASLQNMLDMAVAFRTAGAHDRAIATLQNALRVDSSAARTHYQLAVTYVAMNRLDDAAAELETADRINSNLRFKAYLGYVYAAAGRTDEARAILRQLETRSQKQYVSSFGLALIYDALGDGPRAIAAFERAYQQHAIELAQLTRDPPFRTIAADPRYQLVLQRVQRPPSPPVAASLTR